MRMIVYGLVDAAVPSVIRYIGKTTAARQRKRLSLHLTTSRQGERTHKAAWIRKVLASSGAIEMVVLAEVNSSDEVCRLEREYIALHRSLGKTLTNLTDGGEGPTGRKLSADARARISAASKRLWEKRRAQLGDGETYRWGSCSAERIVNISRATKGKKRTSEQRARISEAHRRTWASRQDRRFTPEHRRHISEALTGKTPTDETRLKMRVSRFAAIARERAKAAGQQEVA